MPRNSDKDLERTRIESALMLELKDVLLRMANGEYNVYCDIVSSELLWGIQSYDLSRYWNTRIQRPTNFGKLEKLYANSTEKEFLTHFRMSKESFDGLVTLVINHEEFQATGNKHQAPAHYQLMVCLKRLGCSGNASGANSLCSLFEISVGTVKEFTKSSLNAMLDLQDAYYTWPNARERAMIAQSIQVKFF